MDPNANLQEQSTCTDTARLRDLRQALAGWLVFGGFAPEWEKHPSATRCFKAWCIRYYRVLENTEVAIPEL
jgi:hypothetical protein